MSEEKPIALVSSDEPGRYTIDIAREDLKDFLGGILGTRRNLQRRIPGRFIIDFDYLINLHHMINQRIIRQHRSVVTNFRSVISYDDEFQRIFDSAEAFESFHDVRQHFITEVRMIYTFLIQFPDKKVPEKQEVKVIFDAARNYTAYNGLWDFDFFEPSDATIIVDYTELTWGDDIERMLTENIRAKFKEFTGPLSKTSRIALISSSIRSFCFLSLSYFAYKCFFIRFEEATRQRPAYLRALTKITTENKVDALLIDVGSIHLSSSSYAAGIWALLPTVGAFIMLYLFTNLRRNSFILTSDLSRSRFIAETKRNNLILYGVVLAFIVSVAAGLATNLFQSIIDHM